MPVALRRDFGQLNFRELNFRELGSRGIGHRPELAAELLAAPHQVDFIEVVAESCFAQERVQREAIALSEVWPVVPHGVKLSLGSAGGIEIARAKKLGDLARRVRAQVVTEHVALTSAGGREIGHLTPVPRSMDMVRVVARNVARARSHLPDVPLLLENIAVPFGFADDAMEEPAFYSEICAATGCDLLLDVANLYANAVNAGHAPAAFARAFPLDRVGMVHLAGGVLEDGFYFDTHAHDVPDGVYDVLAEVFAVVPDVPVVLERDAHFEAGLAPLVAELDRAETLRASAPRAADPPRPLHEPRSSSPLAASPRDLESQQAELARLLVRREPPSGSLAEAIGVHDLERARRVLERKRIEDALPVLPILSRRAAQVWTIAERALARLDRGTAMQGIADAFAIAEAVAVEASGPLADEARRDRLVLRARFAMRGTSPSIRVGPFVARETLASGQVIWAMKGFGAGAKVLMR